MVESVAEPGQSKLFHFTLQSNWTIDFKMIAILKQMKISFPNSCDKNKTNEKKKMGRVTPPFLSFDSFDMNGMSPKFVFYIFINFKMATLGIQLLH